MFDTIYGQLILLFGLLAVSAFFSGSETAFFSLSKFKLKRFEGSRNKQEKLVATTMKHPSGFIVDITLGNMLANIAASSLATVLAMNLFSTLGYNASVGLLVSIFFMSALLLLFGEITPKLIAVTHPVSYSKKVIRALRVFSFITTPVRLILVQVTSTLVKTVGRVLGTPNYQTLTEDEIKTMVEVSQKEGVLDLREKEMIQSVLDFTDTTVKEIMTPRLEIKAVEKNWSNRKVVSYLRKVHVSKLPVYDGTIDKIVGVVYSKDLLLNPKKDYHSLMKPVLFVPDSKLIYQLLNEFKAKRAKIAVVIDEYGGTYGIITMEDILEEIFGEIHDEFETEERFIDKVEKGLFRVKGKVNIDDVNKELKLKLVAHESDTVNGFIMEKIGRIPVKGELLRIAGVKFTIERVSRRRVTSVLIDKRKKRKTGVKK